MFNIITLHKLSCHTVADAKIADELCGILDLSEYEKPMYHTHIEDNYRLSTHRDFNCIYFQYLSFALYSLNEILKNHAEMNAAITDKVKEFIGNKEIILKRLVLKSNRRNFAMQAEALFDFAEKIVQ